MPLLFVFDMDDVLYDYDWRTRMAGLTELTGLDLGELRRRWWHDRGEWAAEAGGFADGRAYLTALSSAIGTPISEDWWVANRAGSMSARPAVLAAVERAKEFGKVSLLTNNGPLIGEHLDRVAPELVGLFGLEHLRASSYYGARKPDPLVYRRLLEAYDEPADHVFFTDDLRDNIAGARSVGITGHLYRDPGTLLAAVEEFGKRDTGELSASRS